MPKTLIDFSSMTDDQLYCLFAGNSIKPCGKFSNSQLERDILPLQQASTLLKSKNALAAIVTIMHKKDACACIKDC